MRTNASNKKYSDAYSLYLNGLSLSQVASEINVTRQCLYDAFKLRNYKMRSVKLRPVQFYNGLKFSLRPSGYFALTSNNRMLMHRFVWESVNGSIPKGYDIHHINEDKTDNRIENLECLPKGIHTSL